MLDYAHLLVQAEDYLASDIVGASLRIFDAWKAKGERIDSVIELGWLEVHHAEGEIARQRCFSSAKTLFGNNFDIDPVTSKHGLL